MALWEEDLQGDLHSYGTSVWSSVLRTFSESFIIALEVSKAFDRVWLTSLLSKQLSHGVSPSICSLLLNYLSNRSFSVMVDGSVSPPQTVNSGIPQGCVLSQTQFLTFINDVLTITSNHIHSYASAIFPKNPSIDARFASRVDTISSLNSDLERVASRRAENLVNSMSQKNKFKL